MNHITLPRAALQQAEPQAQCRADGRCQYAIDSGAEGMGHCPKGKCVMPEPQAQAGEPEVVCHQYQDKKDGTWYSFISSRHYDDTVADGRWPIRAIITLQSHREAMAALQSQADQYRANWREATRKNRELLGELNKDKP